jgi:hypothetical protein
MSRIQLACYGLIGSAFVLAALLVVRMESKPFLPEASADQVITRGNLTIMTARTSAADESLFVLDNASQRLLIYQTRLQGNRGKIDFVDNISLKQLFGGAAGAGGAGTNPGNTGGTRRRPR